MKTILNQSEAFFALLNKFISQGRIPLIDAAYPQHDGELDANVASEIMLLRDRLSAIAAGCSVAIDHLDGVLDLEQK